MQQSFLLTLLCGSGPTLINQNIGVGLKSTIVPGMKTWKTNLVGKYFDLAKFLLIVASYITQGNPLLGFAHDYPCCCSVATVVSDSVP